MTGPCQMAGTGIVAPWIHKLTAKPHTGLPDMAYTRCCFARGRCQAGPSTLCSIHNQSSCPRIHILNAPAYRFPVPLPYTHSRQHTDTPCRTCICCQVWDVRTGRCVRQLSGAQGILYSVSWNSEGRLLAASNDSGVIFVYDYSRGMLVKSLHQHTKQSLK